MKFLGIPTDSLYKSMAISGIIIFIASASLFISKMYEYKGSFAENKAELDFLYHITQWCGGFGALLAMAGFALWYTKLQKYIDIEQSERAEEQRINTVLAHLKLKKETNAQ